jgi:hypothetical protein
MRVSSDMTRPRSTPKVLGYAVVIAAIVVAFGWQMMHGICPVP